MSKVLSQGAPDQSDERRQGDALVPVLSISESRQGAVMEGEMEMSEPQQTVVDDQRELPIHAELRKRHEWAALQMAVEEIRDLLRSQQREGISSVEIKEDTKGQPHLAVKAYHPDVHLAAARAKATYERLADELRNPDLRPEADGG